jgi:hypothetical protein
MDEVVAGSVVDLPQVNALPPRATDNMSGYERFMAGIGKSIVDTGYGLAQQAIAIPSTAVRAGGALSNAVLPEGSRLRELNQRASDIALAPQNSLRATAAERRAIDSDLMSTGAGLAGNVTGTSAQLLTPAMLARGTSLAALAAPTSVRGNAIQGAVLGSLQPSTGGADSAQQAALGGVAGGAGAGVINAGGSALSALRNMASRGGLSSVERRAAEEISSRATNPQSLEFTESAVPGVQRTLGEATLDPGLSALENYLRSQNRGAFDALDMQNNAARVRQLDGIAGTDADMAAAVGERSAAASQARNAAMAAPPAEVAETIRVLDDAIKASRGRSAVQPALESLRKRIDTYMDGDGRIDIATLDNIRMDIGDMLAGRFGGDSGAALTGARELIGVRDALNDEVGRQAPEFTDYLNAYRQMSRPINRMEIGQEIMGVSTGGGVFKDTLGNPTITPGGFGRATKNLDHLASRATGFSKAKASEILTPDDMTAINAIQDDMSRIYTRQKSAVIGPHTAERVGIGASLARQPLASIIPFAGGIIEHMERNANEALKEKLAYLMANPSEAKRVLAALPKRESSALRKTLNQLALAVPKSSAVSAD